MLKSLSLPKTTILKKVKISKKRACYNTNNIRNIVPLLMHLSGYCFSWLFLLRL